MDLWKLVGALLLVGVLLWGINSIVTIDAKIKQMVNVLVIVVVALWLLTMIFGIHIPNPHIGR